VKAARVRPRGSPKRSRERDLFIKERKKESLFELRLNEKKKRKKTSPSTQSSRVDRKIQLFSYSANTREPHFAVVAAAASGGDWLGH
jgi:hypothetical protein